MDPRLLFTDPRQGGADHRLLLTGGRLLFGGDRLLLPHHEQRLRRPDTDHGDHAIAILDANLLPDCIVRGPIRLCHLVIDDHHFRSVFRIRGIERASGSEWNSERREIAAIDNITGNLNLLLRAVACTLNVYFLGRPLVVNQWKFQRERA